MGSTVRIEVTTADQLDKLFDVFLSAFKDEATTAVWLDLSSEKLKYFNSIHQIVEKSGGKFLGGYAMHSAPPGRFAGKEYILKQLEEKHFNQT